MAHRAETLLSALESHIQTRRAPLAAGVLCQLAPAVRCKAVIQPMEVAAIDFPAVGKTEQARRVEPDTVRLLAAV